MAGPLGGEFEKADVELSEHLAGVHPVDELRAAEAVQLVTSKRQPAVLGHHRGVPRGVRPVPFVRVVLAPVELSSRVSKHSWPSTANAQ